MGNLLNRQSNKLLSNAYNPSMEGWTLVERRTEYNIWRNHITQQQIQQYRFMVNDQEEFNRQKAIFEARYNNDNLISSRFFVDDSQKQFCSGYFKGNLFVQRIPFQIYEVQKIGFPEILHVYSQCFKGLAELYDAVGYFSLNEQMIGINTDGVVKVWLNKDYGKSIPQAVYVQGTEREMMIRLVKIISTYTQQRLPVNLADLLLRNNPSSFRDAYITLESLSTRFNADIPDYLPSVFGRMKKMIKGESRVSEVYSGSQFIPQSRHSISKPNLYKNSIATDSVLSFKETSQKGQTKVHFRKAPIDYDPHHSMASAFPELSRISKISLPKERKPQYFPVNTFSPPAKSKHAAKSQAPSFVSKQSPVKYFAPPQPHYKTQQAIKNTQLYYSGVVTSKIPAESIKHLPIIRQNVPQQSSLAHPNQRSFNYHVSDHNKLTEKYLNKFKNPQQTSYYTNGHPQSFDLNNSFRMNAPVNQSHQRIIQKYEVNPQSKITQFSIPKRSQYQQSKSNTSAHHYSNRQPRSSNKISKVSQYSLNKSPIVSQSRTGVVYKQTDLHQPTIISEPSMLNQSFNVEEILSNKKVNMTRYMTTNQNKLGTINESFSRQIDPDFNGFVRKNKNTQAVKSKF